MTLLIFLEKFLKYMNKYIKIILTINNYIKNTQLKKFETTYLHNKKEFLNLTKKLNLRIFFNILTFFLNL